MKSLKNLLFSSLLCTGSLWAGELSKDLKFSLGGLIQPSYKWQDSHGKTTDELRFRRLRAIFKANFYEHWSSKVLLDFGLSNTAIRGAYIKYSGWENMDFRIGSSLAYFSREMLTSNSKQILVERQHVGSKNYGSPLFQTGFHLKGTNKNKTFWYGSTLAIASHEPGDTKLEFEDTIQLKQSDTNSKADWSDGVLGTLRVGWHPYGPVAYSQGILKAERKWGMEAGVMAWDNDNDNLQGAVAGANDLDRVVGYELSSSLRYDRFALDAQMNIFQAKLVLDSIDSGLYEDSETSLRQFAIEGGYSIIMSKLEWAVGYQTQNADGYDKTWTKMSTGFNYYLQGHDMKVQVTYTRSEDANGVDGVESDELISQFQISF